MIIALFVLLAIVFFFFFFFFFLLANIVRLHDRAFFILRLGREEGAKQYDELYPSRWWHI